ncbi:hypothetical protein HGA64_01430 [Candidatus Falkowbacteria bacterium]|nr:hypothetical protein [Candidatus Falkowbacteria bacterium]
MTRNEVTQKVHAILGGRNVICRGHYVFAKKPEGWFHGDQYINKDAIYPYHGNVKELCGYMAYASSDLGIEVVVGPTVGGVSLSQWTAYGLEVERPHQKVLSVYADEEPVIEEVFFSFAELDNVVENLVSSGSLSRTLADAYGKIIISSERGGIIIPIKVETRRVLKRGYDQLVRGKRCLITEDIRNSGATIRKTRKAIEEAGGEVVHAIALCDRSGGSDECQALYTTKMEMYPEDSCPFCAMNGMESVDQTLGKGKEFLIRKGLSQFLKH